MAVSESIPAAGISPDVSAPVLDAGEDRLHIHICEASRVQRAILCRMLGEAGFETSASGHAEDSLKQLSDTPPDIFMTAIELPDFSGLESCWLVKANPETEHIHTMVLTASGQEDKLAESLDSGADDYLTKPLDPNELKARLRAASRIVRLTQRMRTEAETDALTGAYNRRVFMRTLEREHKKALDQALPFSVAMVDLDFFKKINDTHGHASGDRVLIETVRQLKALLRPPAMLGRLGGEEFAVVLPGQDEQQARQTCETLRETVQAMHVENDVGQHIAVTASLGLAVLNPGDLNSTGEHMLARADGGLYDAKEGGRNQVCMA
ncbi:GGDEF domain-containing response regulator [Oceanicaulis sp.]|uniref:GGDEF domain-containing response regulator n=1 Tax=Oceanicaulis sp. TaxID=1924941 RepID=UPI003D2E21BB